MPTEKNVHSGTACVLFQFINARLCVCVCVFVYGWFVVYIPCISLRSHFQRFKKVFETIRVGRRGVKDEWW